MKCELQTDGSVKVTLTAIVDEGTDCSPPEVSRISHSVVIPVGGSDGGFRIVAEECTSPTNGVPCDRTEIAVPVGGLVNGPL
jgi:hypothetical protein